MYDRGWVDNLGRTHKSLNDRDAANKEWANQQAVLKELQEQNRLKRKELGEQEPNNTYYYGDGSWSDFFKLMLVYGWLVVGVFLIAGGFAVHFMLGILAIIFSLYVELVLINTFGK